MVNINRSFLYGIAVASITWITSLYLYLELTKDEPNNGTTKLVRATALESNTSKSVDIFMSFAKTGNQQFRSNNYSIGDNKKLKIQGDDLISLGMVRSKLDQAVKDEGYKVHAYNVLISNKLSFNRSIPDTRNDLCKSITYQKELPTASVVICFYNEHYQTLLRSVYSILDRTPANLLHEVILVDDFSDIPDLHLDLHKYVLDNGLEKVKLLKTERREGLIRARLHGSRRATGEVLVFLDSHIEVNIGWIEPLLDRIKTKQTNVVMPVIDIINPDTFVYSSSPLVRGGFNWGLHFKWESLPKGSLDKIEDFVKPIKSPTMAGGLFAIDSKYFVNVGEYDAGMNIWGGENLEISFRVWMCGGNLELIPCSRVGHIFRHRRPYGSPDGQDTMLYNSLRVAYVWMDDYKDNFLKLRPDAKDVNYGDITSRIQLRKELKCNDFDWYLKNVYPELILPNDDETRLKKKWSALERQDFQPWHSRKRNYIEEFQIRLSNSTLCTESAKDIKTKGSSLLLRPCSRRKNQMWYETDKGELVLAQLLCLQADKMGPILYKCHEMGADQEWKHKGGEKTPIYNLGAGTCLGANKKQIGATLVMRICTDTELNMWDLIKA